MANFDDDFADDGLFPINFPMYTDDAKRQDLIDEREDADLLGQGKWLRRQQQLGLT